MDEDTLTIPATWRRRLHPRRGGAPCPAITIDPAAAGALRGAIDAHAADLEETLGDPRSDPALVAATRRYLAGDDDPLGASVAAQIAIRRENWRDDPHTALVDAWCARHGAAFAAEAITGLGRAEPAWRTTGDSGAGESWVAPRDPDRQEYGPWWTMRRTLRRMRAVLAAAGDAEYERAVTRLRARREDPLTRLLTAYLAPTRQDWVDECVADRAGVPGTWNTDWILLCSVQSAAQLTALGGVGWSLSQVDVATSVVDGVGAAAAPFLADGYDTAHHAQSRRNAAELLAILPTDEAFQALLDRAGKDPAGKDRAGKDRVRPALAAAAKRFPVRAARLLRDAASGTGTPARTAAELLAEHLTTHPHLAGGTPAARIPGAPPQALPASLTNPPWKRGRPPRQTVIGGLAAPGGGAVRWADGERETWSRNSPHWPDQDAARNIADYRAGRLGHWWSHRVVAARYELDAVPLLLDAARSAPAEHGEILLPFLTPRIAALMADWAFRLKSMRPLAHAWFARHGTAAAVQLIPAALGPAGKARQAAQVALLHIARTEGDAAVEDAARTYGQEAAAAVAALLEADVFDLVPVRAPKIGDWADPALLPQVLLSGRDRALPEAATRTLLATLALLPPGGGRPEVSGVLDACDTASLAAFSWALFERWEAAGHPAKDGWALTQLGLLGGDDAARRLTPLIRAWPGQSRHQNAAAGLDVLAEIGTDVALTHLHGISQKLRFKALRDQAREKIHQIAGVLGLSRDELADRIVPGLGLDDAGTLVLDYGPRRFTVGFDELLKPYVLDGDGKARASLPRPGAKDDPDLAPAAYKRFAALRKDVRAVAAGQVLRLETAMIERRTWTAPDFRRLLASHPLLRHIVRRLVWTTGETARDGTARDGATFRVAEDGTFADADDDAYTLPDTATVRLAHPLDPPGALAAWARVFADYEIAQPFPQLDRPVHALTARERDTGNLDRFEGTKVPLGRLLGLERRGWEHETPADAGIVDGMSRDLPGGGTATLRFEPAVAIGDRDPAAEVAISVWISDAAALDAITASELLAELTAATGA
ncbi:DUF4132 domain-containing protein [Actinomadura sp. 9N215]|uniref:DUF4132 domain-containing protein n=1 Tax=Actinomadura sp. 9N215 TaxID=3375150 RepID=UPI0037A32333